MTDRQEYASIVLRYGIGLLLLWFSLTNIFTPSRLVGYLPNWATAIIPVAPTTFMFFNGLAELLMSLGLLLGILTRTAALIAAIHIFTISLSLGYNDIGIRDAGLSIAALSIFLRGHDKWCLYKKW